MPRPVLLRPLQAFLRLEAASGMLLLFCAVVALVWANLHPQSYHAAFGRPLRIVINDGLMTIFFLVVGMEIKRELAVGELDSLAKASLPAIAALGGMILPVGIFLAFNWGGAGQRGWGIPMATDIAFCIGVLTIVKDRVPRALVVFVTALAILDDVGGILVIALCYGHGLHVPWLLGAGGLTLALFGMNRAYVVHGLAYAVVGAGLWCALLLGGIHATIAGVVLGLMIPARTRREDLPAPIHRFVHLLHPFAAFFVMPIFALANSGVSIRGTGISSLAAPVALGTAAGLFMGKQLGIFGLTLLAVKLGIAPMPGNASRLQLFGVSVVAGIGFTVALFIAALAYRDAAELLDQAKVGILLGSFAAAVVGFVLLRFVVKTPTSGRSPIP